MRICLFSGPGAGKTAVSSRLFYEFKVKSLSVELVQEYIKTWAYQNIVPESFDQFYVLAKQLRSEDLMLRHTKYIVTDSPLFMQCAYMKRDRQPYYDEAVSICRKFETKHPSLNIFLSREGIDYQQSGRYENLMEAKQMDWVIRDELDQLEIPYKVLPTKDLNAIMEYVFNHAI